MVESWHSQSMVSVLSKEKNSPRSRKPYLSCVIPNIAIDSSIANDGRATCFIG